MPAYSLNRQAALTMSLPQTVVLNMGDGSRVTVTFRKHRSPGLDLPYWDITSDDRVGRWEHGIHRGYSLESIRSGAWGTPQSDMGAATHLYHALANFLVNLGVFREEV